MKELSDADRMEIDRLTRRGWEEMRKCHIDQLREAVPHDPFIYRLFHMVEKEGATWEQAAIAVVLALYETKKVLADDLLKHMERCVSPMIHSKGPGK